MTILRLLIDKVDLFHYSESECQLAGWLEFSEEFNYTSFMRELKPEDLSFTMTNSQTIVEFQMVKSYQQESVEHDFGSEAEGGGVGSDSRIQFYLIPRVTNRLDSEIAEYVPDKAIRIFKEIKADLYAMFLKPSEDFTIYKWYLLRKLGKIGSSQMPVHKLQELLYESVYPGIQCQAPEIVPAEMSVQDVFPSQLTIGGITGYPLIQPGPVVGRRRIAGNHPVIDELCLRISTKEEWWPGSRTLLWKSHTAANILPTDWAEILAAKTNTVVLRANLATMFAEYVGESEERIRKLFKFAETHGAVLLVEGIDLVGGKEKTNSARSELTTLLLCLDGVDSSSSHRLNCIGISSIPPNQLEDSLIRPGRFDKLIEFRVEGDIPKVQ